MSFFDPLRALWAQTSLPFLAVAVAAAATAGGLLLGWRRHPRTGAVALTVTALLALAIGGAGVATLALREPQACVLEPLRAGCDQTWARYWSAWHAALVVGGSAFVVPLLGAGGLGWRAATRRPAGRRRSCGEPRGEYTSSPSPAKREREG